MTVKNLIIYAVIDMGLTVGALAIYHKWIRKTA